MSRLISPAHAGVFLAAIALTSVVQAEPISFTDHEQRAVELSAPAERIAVLPMPIPSTVIALDGGPDKLVGINPVAKTALVEGILGRIFPAAKDIPADITAPNFIPNVEELAATNPDLVIQWADRGPDYVDPIINAGLTAMLISYGTEEKTREYMTMIGQAIGKPERAEELIAWRDEVQADIAEKSAEIPDEDRPKVLYLLRALEGLRASGTEGNYNSWYIDLAGGTNAAADLPGGWADVNVEQIASWNPDVILLNSFEPELDPSRIYDDPILSLTNAAQEGRVYKLPLGGYRWDPPNAESPLTWMWLANLLHPDVFAYDLRAEMKDAYRTLYAYDLTEADIDGILNMDMQGDAPGFAQFRAKE